MANNAAEMLEGLTLDGGWFVEKFHPKNPALTGANFSQCYTVRSANGQRAFLKALDFHRAFQDSPKPTEIIERITSLFNFERDLLGECGKRNMDRVVKSIASGTVRVDPTNPFALVPYLIFERADSDIRVHLDDPIFANSLQGKLRAIHHVATGLKQLHGADIAHQDLKPSNVLIFYVNQMLTISKIADLGRASRKGQSSPYDDQLFAGDRNYAPPEILYSHLEHDWSDRRISADLYMLGGLLSFVFAKTTSIASLLQSLETQFWPGSWGSTFEEVLPYLNNAFSDASDLFGQSIPSKLRGELMLIYSQLCNPDPRKRGFPGVTMNRNALERYLSSFDLMANRAKSGRYD